MENWPSVLGVWVRNCFSGYLDCWNNVTIYVYFKHCLGTQFPARVVWIVFEILEPGCRVCLPRLSLGVTEWALRIAWVVVFSQVSVLIQILGRTCCEHWGPCFLASLCLWSTSSRLKEHDPISPYSMSLGIWTLTHTNICWNFREPNGSMPWNYLLLIECMWRWNSKNRPEPQSQTSASHFRQFPQDPKQRLAKGSTTTHGSSKGTGLLVHNRRRATDQMDDVRIPSHFNMKKHEHFQTCSYHAKPQVPTWKWWTPQSLYQCKNPSANIKLRSNCLTAQWNQLWGLAPDSPCSCAKKGECASAAQSWENLTGIQRTHRRGRIGSVSN